MGVGAVAKQAQQSDAVDRLARWGLVCRGLVYAVVGLLALSVVLGGDERTDKDGALRAIADRPLGEPLLVAIAVGFAGYAAWRLLSAAVGHRQDDEPKRTGRRLLSLTRGLFYLGLSATTVRFLATGPGEDQLPSLTKKVLGATGGRTLVMVVGLVVVGSGLVIAVRAARQSHDDKLDPHRLPARWKRAASVVGVVGLVGRGLVISLIGVFLVKAAWEFDSEEARGLDAALDELARQPAGRVLLSLAVVGLLGYALWSFVEAAWRRTD